MKTSFYSDDELINIGFKKIGTNCNISRYARFYTPKSIEIGDNVRIDDFCILSGSIILKNNIHISAFSALYGSGGIIMEDYTGLSPRCSIFSATDDFSGDYLIGPHNPIEFTNVRKGLIRFEKFCQLGANTIVLPGVIFGEGSVTGALSLVNEATKPWMIYIGIPAKALKKRSKKLLNFLYE